jgi:hypothetical protein
VSDFPERISVDADNRPHCEDGPSHRWRDGWELWHWHGLPVTEQIVMRPQTVTAEQVAAQENVEIRRIMIERMGWDKYAAEAGVSTLHIDELDTALAAIPVSELVSDSDRLVTTYRAGTEQAELLECTELRDFENRPIRLVRLTDPSTGRRYTLRVAYNTKRCYQGVAASFGLTESQYRKTFYKRQGDVMLKPLNARTKGLQAHS